MIIIEFYKTRDDGTNLVHTYSDKGYMIERDGILYKEAIDPENSGRTYTETEMLSEVTVNYEKIIDILTGNEEG